MFEKVLDESKEKAFKEQMYHLNIDIVKRLYKVNCNKQKSLDYMTKLFYPNGVNGIKIIEESENSEGKKVDFVLEADIEKFNTAMNQLKDEWTYTGRIW